MNRRGFIAIWLMLALAGMITIMGVVLYTGMHSVRTGASMENGLIAQYAAESGAVWGLEKVKAEGWISWDGEMELTDGSRCRVRIAEQENGKGMIRTRGTAPAGAVRHIQLTVKVNEGETRSVKVEDIGNTKWN